MLIDYVGATQTKRILSVMAATSVKRSKFVLYCGAMLIKSLSYILQMVYSYVWAIGV